MGNEDLVKTLFKEKEKNRGLKYRGDHYPKEHLFEYVGESGALCENDSCDRTADYRINFIGPMLEFDSVACLEHSMKVLESNLFCSINELTTRTADSYDRNFNDARKLLYRLDIEYHCNNVTQLVKWMSHLPIDYSKRMKSDKIKV